MRIYQVSTSVRTVDFANYRKAGRYYRKLKRDGAFVIAKTYVRDGKAGPMVRLDFSDGTPVWARDPKFSYKRY
jgi:hypothetical protein